MSECSTLSFRCSDPDPLIFLFVVACFSCTNVQDSRTWALLECRLLFYYHQKSIQNTRHFLNAQWKILTQSWSKTPITRSVHCKFNSYTSPVSSQTHTMMVLKLVLLNFLFSQKLINSRPCLDSNPGPPRQQAAVLIIEL